MRKGQIGFNNIAKLVIGIAVALVILYVLLGFVGLVKRPS